MLHEIWSELWELKARIPTNKTTANTLSMTGVLICGYSGLMASQGKPLWLVGLVFLAGSVIDAFDGRIARALNETSAGSAYFDALCDKLGEMALYLGLVCGTTDPGTMRWLMAASLSGLLCSYIKTLAAENGIRLEWRERKVFGRGLRVAVLVGGLLLCSATQSSHGLRYVAQTAFWSNLLICVWREKQIEIACWLDKLKSDPITE